MVMSQNAAEKKNSITCILLPEQSTAPCLFLVLSKIKLPHDFCEGPGSLSPSLHSFNTQFLPSASLASLAQSFANVSHRSGSDWSNSAVCDSVGTCPRRMVSLTKTFFPCYLWSVFTRALLFISYIGQG